MLHMSLTEASNYQRNLFVLDSESKPLELPSSTENLARDLIITEDLRDAPDEAPKVQTFDSPKDQTFDAPKDQTFEAPKEVHVEALEVPLEIPKEDLTGFPPEAPNELSKEADTVSNSHERKRLIKIKVRQSSATSRADTDNQMVERSLGGREIDHGASSSVSVDAPQRFAETISIGNNNIEEVNSWHDPGSRMTASIGSVKILSDGDELVKELQCTADSSVVYSQPQPEDPSPSSFIQDNNIDADARRFASLQTLSVGKFDHDGESFGKEVPARAKDKHKSKDKKRKSHKGHHDDPEYLERKRLKKEKKRKEKELAKLQSIEAKKPSIDLSCKKEEPKLDNVKQQLKSVEPSGNNSISDIGKIDSKPIDTKPSGNNSISDIGKIDTKPRASEGTSGAPKIRIKIKNRMLSKS
ncbi:transcription initiation factor TFIID subunit 2-like protein [Trifolium pratense]|uniref:Transcription initiation factor TFIID subunit 2-like protein n=1 Tax=Trifolium pratense TaxID=57577 RepID=A0A2K3NB12_TRIPR|nr:transcription initiation factor TFIID subunit 2-like protein [Trifolium pratense]